MSAKEPEHVNTPMESWIQQVNLDNSNLTHSQKHEVLNLIADWHDVFSKHDLDVGLTSLVKHRINLNDVSPFKQRHRKIPHSMYAEVRDHLQQLLDIGIIRKSQSPWSSNMVLVRKKDSSLRLCVDFRQLNRRTVMDAYALPRIDELLEGLGGNRYYSVLDMKSGYHQVEVEENHKQYTAFTAGPLGFYEYERLPFGLSNSPATYQRLMESCLSDLMFGEDKVCHIYLDDVIVATKTFSDHKHCLEKVFSKMKDAGMKLSPKKCYLFQDKVKYVGHVVSSQGIETDPEKTKKISTWPTPTNVDEVRTYLGFTSYYRRFVKDFAAIAKPLNALIGGSRNKRKRAGSRSVDSRKWEWGERQQAAFDKLKQALTSPPILAYPDYSKPFVLHTDASSNGLGAVLYQNFDGIDRVIAYASRGLSQAEQRYQVHKQEFLALKWAVTSKFHDYLYGTSFVVFTDNNPMTYVLEKAKLDATGHRWVAALGVYDFTIKYRTGKSNADADGLSRMPQVDEYKEVSPDSVKALCQSQTCTPYVTSLSMTSVPMSGLNLYEEITPRNWRQLQSQDPVVDQFVRAVTTSRKPDVSRVETRAGKILLREFNKLVIKRGVLYRKTQVHENPTFQLVIPEQYKLTALQGAHDDMGHLGRDKTLSVLRDRVYWPNLTNDVDQYLKACDRCIKRKTSTDIRVPLVSIKTTQPMELVCVDYLSLEMSKGGYEHLLVITDHFTKYAVAIPTKNQTAVVTAEALFNNFIVHYGFMKRLHSDQGAQFEGHVIKELCKLAGVCKSRTTPYNPSCNGITERFNRTLLGMLGTLDPNNKQDWKSQVSHLVHAYNCCKHTSTGFSPYRLMFGRQPRLALDVVLGLISDDPVEQEYGKYVSNLRNSLKRAYEVASRSCSEAQDRQKFNHDLCARAAVLEVGDRVLVKILAVKGKNKIADRWEDNPYIILDQFNDDIPVYNVQRENGEGPIRTLHRKHLLPIGSLPVFLGTEGTAEQSVKTKNDNRRADDQAYDQISTQESVQTDITDQASNTIEIDSVDYDGSDSESGDMVVETVMQTNEPSISEADYDIHANSTVDETDLCVHSTHLDSSIDTDIVDVGAESQTIVDNCDVNSGRIPVPGNRPVPVPRRSLRNRKPPDRYGEWVNAHINRVPYCADNAHTKTNETHSHEVLGFTLIDKILDKLITK